MRRSLLTLIVAVADSGVIGRDNALPWHLPDDLKRFKRLTLGKPVIMGRKTFESIGRPLPGRHNVVVTRDPNYRRVGITVAHDLDAALSAAESGPEGGQGEAPGEIFIIGGAELFRLSLPRAGRLQITRVHGDIPGDVKWPEVDPREWRLTESEPHGADERHAWPMTFEVWERA